MAGSPSATSSTCMMLRTLVSSLGESRRLSSVRRPAGSGGLPSQAPGWRPRRGGRGVRSTAKPVLRARGLPATANSAVAGVPGPAGLPGDHGGDGGVAIGDNVLAAPAHGPALAALVCCVTRHGVVDRAAGPDLAAGPGRGVAASGGDRPAGRAPSDRPGAGRDAAGRGVVASDVTSDLFEGDRRSRRAWQSLRLGIFAAAA